MKQMIAEELLMLAKELLAGQKYKGYTIDKSGENFSVKDPAGHRAFNEVPASVETAKKWIDQEIQEKGKKASIELTAKNWQTASFGDYLDEVEKTATVTQAMMDYIGSCQDDGVSPKDCAKSIKDGSWKQSL